MFRHALRSQAFSSLKRPAAINGLRLRPYSWATTASCHGLMRTALPAKPVVLEARRGIAGLSFDNDTIYALSSAQGRAGIAVIRISGPGCANVYAGLCPSKPPPKPRYAAVRTLYEPGTDSNIVDSSALVLSFPSPNTVTGEDVLELHVHGGPATVKAVLSAISKCPSSSKIRYAEPGEFTKRAFINNRLDLAQVEALSDTLAAETEQQRRAAVRGSSGVLGKTYEGWRSQLLLARAEIEALIDFSEDQHFDESPTELLSNVADIVRRIVRSIRLHEVAGQRTELLRNGIRIALLGPPNAGKSSLMNLVVGREASIVSHEAGTTRDVVEASLDIRGYLCSFADTAGFRTAARADEEVIGAVEEEGIRRARRKAEEADVVVVLASVESVPGGGHGIVYDPETLRLASAAEQHLVVVNKRDAVDDEAGFRNLISDFKARAGLRTEPITISCREAAENTMGGGSDPGGLHGLISALAASFGELTELPSDMQDLLGVTERQRQLLVECRGHLEEFLAEADVVLAAEHLRSAANCLARITGRGEGGDVEEVLGVIFEKFCVGK
ncbi:P-loop containing nucleoside triphosphate hydrolase protein [Coniochaeta ligniaria NRRL 30616]|uniref:p-loop containing nucleoside triphosphate hydrolase protein n=1 Tax=Coniochaeta ligniaria NRRL 30616 TaxID=1408157 RepID=A0A1J7IRX8_9PEZI|nr:P-loop containing nucleoside triphosphate hydrolase protein [Coniochaeta ligniaria NRRL 30616]